MDEQVVEEQIKQSQNKVVGTKQTMKALEKGAAIRVFIAGDAEEKVIKPVVSLCEELDIQPHYIDTMFKLGKLFGIKVKAATAAILED